MDSDIIVLAGLAWRAIPGCIIGGQVIVSLVLWGMYLRWKHEQGRAKRVRG